MKKVEISEYLGDRIRSLYDETKSCVRVADVLELSRSTVYRYLKSIDYVVDGYSGPRETKKELDDRFFENINSEVKAYWLGFLAADGCVRKTKKGQYHVTLRLAAKDTSHIELFKKQLKSSHKIRTSTNKEGYTYSSICLARKSLHDDLTKHGVWQNKTFTLEFPYWLRDDLKRHWIRGYFDGDGCWYIHKQITWSIVSASPGCLHQIQSEISKACGFEMKKLYNKGNFFRLTYEGRGRAKSLHDYMYSNATVWLDRKRNISEME